MDFKEWMELAEAQDLMSGFKGWYDYNRGAWGEVEAAAQRDPHVRMIVNRIQSNLKSLSDAGPWGDELEAAVEKDFPNHSKRKARERWEKMKFQGSQPSQSQGSVPTGSTRDAETASYNAGFQLRQPSGQPRSTQQAPPDDNTEISRIVGDHERRLRNLETFLKSHRPQLHTVGAMDATASYHR